MGIIISRKTSTGRGLTVGIESERIVARLDGRVIEPVGISGGHIESIDTLHGPGADALRKAGKTHLLQGNIGISADEAAAIQAAKTNIQREARARLERAVPGLEAYEAAMRTYIQAVDAFDTAKEHGYPVAEAQALRAAEDTLKTVYAKYPATVASSKIEEFCLASHDIKSTAGDTARRAVQAGGNPIAAAAEMEASWDKAAMVSARD